MATLDTDFNINPYYDDYDSDKQFNRVLFKPSVAVQARELTQLQTILQEQVRRFGNNIYKEGTIVDGCAFSYNSNYHFVKIKDVDANGSQISVSSTVGHEARGSITGVKGVVNNAISGLQSQDPNLNTLYIDYFETGTNGDKVFSATENIEIYNSSNTLIATAIAAGSAVTNAVGTGFAVSCSEGVIFAKGHFLSVDKSFVVVSKYNNTPHMASVGFAVEETIITSDADTSLLDNAAGFNNENAPGADRLKLSPYLEAVSTGDAIANANFMSIMDFQAGLPVMRKTTTQYNQIADEMAKRTREESGSYTVRTNDIGIESPVNINAHNVVATAGNTTLANSTTQFELTVGAGLHYVNGYRAEQYNLSRIGVPRAIANASITDVSVSTTIGQYIFVNEYIGNFDCHEGTTVSLYDSTQTAITDLNTPAAAAEGNKIGEARVRAIEFDNDGIPGQKNGVFKLYLFDIDMNQGKSFKNVRSVYQLNKGAADIILNGGDAVLQERNLSTALYYLPKLGMKAATQCSYNYRTGQTTSSLTSNTILISATDTQFPYSGVLSRDQKRDFVIIANKTENGLVNSHPINTDDISITVGGVNNTEATIDISGALSGSYTGSLDIIHNERAVDVLPLNKTFDTAFIKVDTSNNATTTAGPFSLGIPDIKEIVSVKQGNSSWDYTDSNYTDITDNFILNKNCYDNFYGIPTATKRPTLTLSADDRLLFEVKAFKSEARSGGKGFYTVSSYKQSDGSTALSPGDIPLYTSERTGNVYDLRNMIDFRPQVANTGAYSNTVSGATINPASTEAFSGNDLIISTPNSLFTCDIEYYLPRVDRLILTEGGYLQVKQGTPSSQPLPPPAGVGALSLGIINIPPFPSLTPSEAADKERRNEAIMVLKENTKRYTMEDISSIEKRLQSLEYNVALNALEQKTSDLVITDENGLDRFKSGILVDPCTDFKIADTSSSEFRVAQDTSTTMFVPRFKKKIINLRVANTTNATVFENNTVMPQAQEYLIIDQAVGTNSRFCTENFYQFNGKVKISPQYDSGYSETKLPTNPIIIDAASSINEVFDTFADTYPLEKISKGKQIGTSSSVSYSNTNVTVEDIDIERQSTWNRNGTVYSSNSYWWNSNRDVTKSTTTETKTTTTVDTYDALITTARMGVKETETKLGDFVKDIQFKPYMRAKNIKIVASGLRPNTPHYFFFDEVNVNDRVRRGHPTNYRRYGGWNRDKIFGQGGIDVPFTDHPGLVHGCGRKVGTSGVKTDDRGRLYAVFSLPKDTFLVGDRQLIIMDVNNIGSKDEATSKAQTKYNAYNYSVEKYEDLTITTREPEVIIDTRNDTYKEETVSSADYVKETSSTYTYDNYWGNNTYEYTVTNTYDDIDNTKTYTYEYNYGANSSYKHTTTTSASTISGTGDSTITAGTGNYNNYYGGYYNYYGIGLGFSW